MLLASAGLVMTENWWRVAIGLAATIAGFILKEISDQIRERKKVKRLAYAVAVGSAMNNVPESLAEQISIQFAGQSVEGQLFETTCTVTNSGHLVVKNQYLRFSFPSGCQVLKTYLVGDPPIELGVEEAPLEQPRQTDRRWRIAHLEKNQSTAFGFLVSGPAAKPPAIFGHNDEGGVELVSKGKLARENNAAGDIGVFTSSLLLAFALPSVPDTVFDLFFSLVRILMICLALARVKPIAALAASYLTRSDSPTPETSYRLDGVRAESIVIGYKGTIVKNASEEPGPDQSTA
ncbi:hypothetical protein [Nocardia sp. NPDC004722]